MKRRNLIILMISLSLSLVLLLGSSYALLRSTKVGSNPYVINVGTLQVIFDEGKTEKLSLENMYPMSDKEGSSLPNELGFTVKNTGTVASYYDVYLEETSTTPEFKSVIRFISNKDNQGYNEPKTLSEDKYIDVGGYLGINESSSYKVKVWLDYNATEDYMDKTFTAKVVINSFQESEYAKDVIKSKLVKYSESSKEDFPGGLVAVNMDGDLYNETDDSQEIREYRYSGLSVNNYVTFNNEPWRIIGLFKDEAGAEIVKIVKGTIVDNSIIPVTYTKNQKTYVLKENNESPGANYYSYDTVNTTSPSSDWTTAGLQYWLNTEKDDSETPNYGYMHYINDDSKKMIKRNTYYLGNVTVNQNPERNEADIMVTTKDSFIEERGNVLCDSSVKNDSHTKNCNIWSTNKATWKGEIALLYASDYGYTVNSNFWANTFLCRFNQGANKTNWLERVGAFWLISPVSYNNYMGMQHDGLGVNDLIISNKLFRVLPTLYLKSNVKITSGTGEESNPYTLSLA